MVKYGVILCLLLTFGVCTTAQAGDVDFPVHSSVSDAQDQETMTLEVMINNTTKVKMKNIPTSGYMEVYNILGVKITSVNLKSYTDNKYCYLDLPKGLYILRAGKVALKVVVK